MSDVVTEHHRQITEQFTRQAAPFAALHAVDESVALMASAAGLTGTDRVLDVACGPGLVACGFARVAAHVVGVDLTPAMLDQARARQAAEGISNVAWDVADGEALPFVDGAFSVVVSRYALHHFLRPAVVVAEMARVCAPGGRVVAADVYSTTADQSAAYDAMERLRDPSHVRAVGERELHEMFAASGLESLEARPYQFGVNVARLLAATRTPAESAEHFTQIVANDVGHDRLGIKAHFAEDGLRFTFPVVIMAGRKRS